MSRIEGKIRRIFVFILTIFFVSSIFSTAFSKPANSDQPPVEDFVVSDNEEDAAEGGKEKKKPASDEASEDEEESDEEEEEHEPTEEELAAAAAALNKKTEKLVEEVKKIGNNSVGIIECLTKEENSDALDNSIELLETLLDTLLKEKKLNYSDLERYGQRLCNKDRKSPIGNYALGLGLMNKKKPNLKKAMDCLGVAKSAKKPYPGASSAYMSCFLKRFGLYIGLGVVAVIALPIVIIVIKKKKKKAAEAEAANAENADGEPNLDLQKLLDEGKELTDAANQAASGENSEQKPAENSEQNQNPLEKALEENKNVAPTPNTSSATTSATVAPKIESAEVKPATAQTSEAGSAPAVAQTPDNASQATSAAPKKVVRVVKKVRVRKDADGNSYVVSESSSNQSASEPVYQDSAQRKADLEAVRSIIRPTEKPLPPIDTQLDILWGNLSRKAMQGHIGLMARKSDSMGSALAPTTGGGGPVYGGGYSSDNRITDIRLGDVSIDLSEEALKDDLVGKLKMLAITDSELRELFAMKNPAHIPHLIEYIMTKPEPMRLAFVAKEIGNYGDPAVVDTLASLLYHEDERVVLAAIQGLEATKTSAAVIPLCPFLRSEVPLYAQAARTALSKFGAVKIMQALKDLPSFTDIKIKEAGIFVLSRMKGDPVEKILKALLNDESSSVRIQAILAMSYQKNPVYIDSLREFYRIANETEKSMTRKAIVYLNGFNK